MNGDDIRHARFARPTWGGYDASQVDDLLRRIAVELDAGRPAGPLIANAAFRSRNTGFDSNAVSWFLDQLVRWEGHAEPPGMSADPWRDLAVVNHFTRSGPGDLADRTAAPSRRARWKYEMQDQEYFAQECAEAWRGFGQQPGTHLQWVRARAVRRELRTAEQQTIASLRYGPRTTLSTGGRTFTWKRVTGSSWPGIAEIVLRSERGDGGYPDVTAADRARADAKFLKGGPAARAGSQLRELLDETGTPILYTSGSSITFPGRRWLRFRVRGMERGSAIMTAVDQAGNKVARYRITRGVFPGNVRAVMTGSTAGRVGITVHPDWKLTDELVLAIVISAPWIAEYFAPGGGG